MKKIIKVAVIAACYALTIRPDTAHTDGTTLTRQKILVDDALRSKLDAAAFERLLQYLGGSDSRGCEVQLVPQNKRPALNLKGFKLEPDKGGALATHTAGGFGYIDRTVDALSRVTGFTAALGAGQSGTPKPLAKPDGRTYYEKMSQTAGLIQRLGQQVTNLYRLYTSHSGASDLRWGGLVAAVGAACTMVEEPLDKIKLGSNGGFAHWAMGNHADPETDKIPDGLEADCLTVECMITLLDISRSNLGQLLATWSQLTDADDEHGSLTRPVRKAIATFNRVRDYVASVSSYTTAVELKDHLTGAAAQVAAPAEGKIAAGPDVAPATRQAQHAACAVPR